MTLTNCPECEREVSGRALMCPYCGFPVAGGPFSYEYRSAQTLFGLPLVHIVRGPGLNPVTGKVRVAKGIIAIGRIAMGGLAMGGLSVGVVPLGGLSLGIVAREGSPSAWALPWGAGHRLHRLWRRGDRLLRHRRRRLRRARVGGQRARPERARVPSELDRGPPRRLLNPSGSGAVTVTEGSCCHVAAGLLWYG
jgi:hypothetical protein